MKIAAINPDSRPAGGVSKMKKTGELANTCYVEFTPHSAGGTATVAANLHGQFCAPNFTIYECLALARILRADTERTVPCHGG